MLPVSATMSNEISPFRQSRFSTFKELNFTTNSFDIVAVCGNEVECCFDKVERCFDIVAGVDGALRDTVSCIRKIDRLLNRAVISRVAITVEKLSRAKKARRVD